MTTVNSGAGSPGDSEESTADEYTRAPFLGRSVSDWGKFTGFIGIKRRFGRWKSLRKCARGRPGMAGMLVESAGGEPGAGLDGTSPPSLSPTDRCKPMNNPLELSGRLRRLTRPAGGRGLIVGAGRDSRRLARCLGQGPWAGLPVVGFIDAGHPRYKGGIGRGRQLAVHPQTDPVPVLGSIDRLDELVDRSRATHV